MTSLSKYWATVKLRYSAQFSDQQFRKSFYWGLLFLIGSFVINYFAALYAFERASNSVADIVLSNIPVFDVDVAFVWGPIVFWIIVSVITLYDPKKVPFALKSIALLIFTRSIFISLTHIGPFPDHIILDTYGFNWVSYVMHSNSILAFIFSSGADLFFSGHTAFPYLMALLFWPHRLMRLFCLASSVFFAAVVLLGHLHYSIDVASAFFITYGVYHMAEVAFSSDRKRFLAT